MPPFYHTQILSNSENSFRSPLTETTPYSPGGIFIGTQSSGTQWDIMPEFNQSACCACNEQLKRSKHTEKTNLNSGRTFAGAAYLEKKHQTQASLVQSSWAAVMLKKMLEPCVRCIEATHSMFADCVRVPWRWWYKQVALRQKHVGKRFSLLSIFCNHPKLHCQACIL